MHKKINIILALSFSITFLGCARIIDIPKVIWGSSTRALENARTDAISETYKCSFTDCFDTVLSLKRTKKVYKEVLEDGEVIVKTKRDGKFDIFLKNRKKKHIVVMGIEGNLETTEVGIFFSQPSLTTVKVEVTSLSSNAKRKIAQMIFDLLNSRFSNAQ